MTKKLTDKQARDRLVEKYGKAGLAKAAGLANRQSADRWTDAIPIKHAAKIAESLGIPKSEVLPSQFS